MKIEKILVACYSKDFWQTKICVASIRHWYPDIPVSLLKDTLRGDFDTGELERVFAVGVESLPSERFGWGLSKIEAHFLNGCGKVLVLDSDIVMVGPILGKMEELGTDFVVSPYHPEDPCAEWFRNVYYDLDKLRETIDPQFEYPGYVFNTGLIVITPGRLGREDFAPFIDYSGDTPKLLHAEALACADQGILNYLVPVAERAGRLTVGRLQYSCWSKSDEVDTFDLGRIVAGEGYPSLIHWANDHFMYIGLLHRKDILRHYQKQYYRRLPFGELRRRAFNARQFASHYWARLTRHYIPKWTGGRN